LQKPADGAIINPGAIIAPSPEIWGMSVQINAKAHGSRGKMVRIAGRITSCATLALLLVANASPGSAQGTKMSDVADQLRTALAGESVTVTQQGPVTLTSSADSMFPSAGWELNPGAPVLGKIVPTLSKLQRTEIVVSGYTDNATVGPTLQSAGISNNLDLSCKRAASVVVYLVSKGVNPNLLSAQCFGETRPVAPNDTPEGKAKNRRVNITLTGDGT
jgi:chemotaxis protein MotB